MLNLIGVISNDISEYSAGTGDLFFIRLTLFSHDVCDKECSGNLNFLSQF